MEHLKPQTILGILGSGQLARMTALAASNLGIKTYIYCPESGISPAEQVATKTIKGAFSDEEAMLNFCQMCDVVTLENEFIDQSILEAIDRRFPERLFPNAATFKMIGDKISEKEHFQKAGIRVAPFMAVKNADDVLAFAQKHGFPVVLKSSKGGYDGYGNATLRSPQDLREAFTKLKGDLLVEAFIPYERELAIMLARNLAGDIVFYPIAHTLQENHICHFVSVPALLSPALEKEIKEQARKAMEAISAVGIFAFEFFLTKEGELYLNESAPRPHNSGHYTIEGCETSQFENQVRSVCNLPLGRAKLKAPAVVMLNLLGTQNGPSSLSNARDFLSIPDGHLHLYGKKDSKVGRKMGHFTLLGEHPEALLTTLKKLKTDYTL